MSKEQKRGEWRKRDEREGKCEEWGKKEMNHRVERKMCIYHKGRTNKRSRIKKINCVEERSDE